MTTADLIAQINDFGASDVATSAAVFWVGALDKGGVNMSYMSVENNPGLEQIIITYAGPKATVTTTVGWSMPT